MSKNVNLIKSDISNLFQELETIATETKLEEKKKRGYVEPSVSDISNLFEGLEEASRQAKELSSEDTEKLGAFSGLMEQMTSITKKVEDEVTTQINEVVTEFVDEEITHQEEDELREFVEEQETKEPEQPPEKSTDIIEKIVDNLDEMRYNTEVKEELDQIEALRKEFEQYKTALQNQVTKGLATSSGGGEVRLEFLDDVDRDTAKVDGKYLKFDSSSGKFIGADAIPTNESIQDLIGDMVSSNTESGITVTYQDADGTLDFTIGTLNQDTTGNAATATILETARTIGGVSFNGSANIDLPGVNSVGNQNTTGSAATLTNARTIGGVSFDGSANINLPGVNTSGNQDTSGNAATATALATGRTIGGVSFDGTANINLPGVNTSGDQDTSGNAATATALATGRTINGTSFDGTANVTVTAAAGTLTGNTLNSGVTASSLTSVGTLTTLTVDNIVVNGTTIGHTDDTDLITLADGLVTVAGNLTVSGTTTTVNQTVVNVTDAFVFEGANADAHETTFRVDEPTADRKASLQDKTGTIALLSGFKLDGTDGSASNAGDFLVLNTSADENDRLLFEDGTSDPIAVLASHGVTLKGQGWNAFRFENP